MIFKIIFKSCSNFTSEINFIEPISPFPLIEKEEIVIDALFGTGLNKKPSGFLKKLSII